MLQKELLVLEWRLEGPLEKAETGAAGRIVETTSADKRVNTAVVGATVADVEVVCRIIFIGNGVGVDTWQKVDPDTRKAKIRTKRNKQTKFRNVNPSGVSFSASNSDFKRPRIAHCLLSRSD